MYWFINLKIRTKLLLSFGAILLMLVSLGIFSIFQLAKVHTSVERIGTGWMPTTNRIQDMNHSIQNFRRCELQHILATTDELMSYYESQMEKINETGIAAESAYVKLILGDEERQLYEQFVKVRTLFVAEHYKIIKLSRQSRKEEAAVALSSKSAQYLTELEDLIKRITILNVKGGEYEYKTSTALYNQAKWLITVMLTTCSIVGVLLAIGIASTICTPLANGVAVAKCIAAGDLTVQMAVDTHDETGQLLRAMQEMVTNLRTMVTKTAQISEGITSASNELQSTSEQIATAAEEVANQTHTVATASEEMSHTSTNIATSCIMAAEASQHTANYASIGAKVVGDTIDGMNIISQKVQLSSKTVEALGARSDQIGQIVGTIEDIADQTNLLALNAAIEAARAGEQGRGFAVVADEVRALAERTTNATREIGEMIKSIQNETKDAVKAMGEGVYEVTRGSDSSQKSGEALKEILARINEVSLQVSQIATAAEEQTATTSEVSMNIQQINEVVQQTARGAEKTASAASSLAQQANELQNAISLFRL